MIKIKLKITKFIDMQITMLIYLSSLTYIDKLINRYEYQNNLHYTSYLILFTRKMIYSGKREENMFACFRQLAFERRLYDIMSNIIFSDVRITECELSEYRKFVSVQ